MNDLLLLATLLAGPMHGYALKKHVATITGQGEMHNNLVYPLLKRFVSQSLVSRRAAKGERGQTRELYALTVKGRQELNRRLAEFPSKMASSADAFSFRVGLFEFLDEPTRSRILDEREKWLSNRAENLETLSHTISLGKWGGEVVDFLREQVQAEQNWITKLQKQSHSR